jgi:hypothetical protein
MMQVPTGRDRVWNRSNVLAWMRQHGTATDVLELADQAARAFGVDQLLAAFEPGEHWAWDLAEAVVVERCRAWAAADPAWLASGSGTWS